MQFTPICRSQIIAQMHLNQCLIHRNMTSTGRQCSAVCHMPGNWFQSLFHYFVISWVAWWGLGRASCVVYWSIFIGPTLDHVFNELSKAGGSSHSLIVLVARRGRCSLRHSMPGKASRWHSVPNVSREYRRISHLQATESYYFTVI